MTRALAFLAIALVPSLAQTADPAVQVRSTVDRTAMWVADRVTLTVDVICDRGVDILLDDLAKEKLRVNGLDILSHDATATTDAAERTTHRLRYVLTTYRVDLPSVSVDPFSVRYYARRPGQRLQDMAPAGEVTVPGAVIAFRSTLQDDQPSPRLRDARAAVMRPPFFTRAQQIGLALVVVSIVPALLVAVAAIRRRTVRLPGRRTARQVKNERTDTLERLRALDVATADERRRAYDEISTAVRAHVAAASGVPASNLTAAELDTVLTGARGRVPRESVTALLAACDAARYGPPEALPSAQACREALATAQQMLGGR